MHGDLLIVGICGAAGVGKSTAADYLERRYGFNRRRFAGPIKAMMKAFGLTEAHVDGDLKAEPCELLGGKTPRQAMQWLGTEWGRDLVCPDLWIRAWAASLPAFGNVVVDDVRFENEAAEIRKRNGMIIMLRGRGGIPGTHISESLPIKPDLIISNKGSVTELERVLASVVDAAMKEAA